VLKQQISEIHASNVHPELRGIVGDIHSELHKSDFRKIDTHRLSDSMQKFEKKAGELVKGGAQKEVDATAKSMSKLGGRAEKLMTSSAAVSRYENVGQSIKSIPGSIAKTSAFHGVVNASFVGASVVSMANDARSFTKQLAILKRMYADMTGTDVSKVSSVRVLFGSAPAPVRMARASMLKFAAISEVADAIGVAVNLKGMMGKGFSMMAGLIAYQVPQMISSTAGKLLNQEELQNYLAAYDHASKAQAAGQKTGQEDYAQLLHFADPDLKNKSLENSFLVEVSKQFADAQTSVADVLKATANGDVTLRLSKLRVDNDAASEASAAAVETHVQADVPAISQVDRLGEKKQHPRMQGAMEEKAIHGAFTQKEVSRANSPDISPVATR
jgi:hypothetical protein